MSAIHLCMKPKKFQRNFIKKITNPCRSNKCLQKIKALCTQLVLMWTSNKNYTYWRIADSRSSITTIPSTFFHAEARCRILFFNLTRSADILSQGSGQLLALPRARSSLWRPSPEQDGLIRRSSNTRRVSSDSRMKDQRHYSNNEIELLPLDSVPVVQVRESGTSVQDTYMAKAMEISLFGSKVKSLSKQTKLKTLCQVLRR